ncbi:MAG: tetratricopeptide repeat protein [Chloroflexi bacterium]|nr:tetratricopeptide repeat protein [Chloroflexota bacterium]
MRSIFPSGTITFLFTDIEGSTQLWEKHPEAMKSALAKHDSLLRKIFESNRGHVFKTVGDAFCVAFASPSDALTASLEAQRAWGVTHCLAGEYAEAEERLNRALKIFQTLNTRWQIGCTLFEFGELSRAQNKIEEARENYSRALAAFEEMRAVTDATQTRVALEALG